MDNINFGIDLGTTNSGIGKYENGKVQVLKNPVGHREILSSVVSFRKGRIIVGDKAREQYLSNAQNVFSAFKRKIGTNEIYPVNQQDEITEVSAIDLSAYVLKELKSYIHGNPPEAAVITIPASFDTIQSNATKKAGYLAGFEHVVLLQEPVAACLAYANLSHLNIEDEQRWLVYDFGGGTFDTALVYINQRELKVIDNKGNNFLGGVDIDHAFIAQVIIPRLAELTGDAELWQKVSQKTGVYEKLWHYLNYQAEEAKKELSMSPSVWIEINFPELDISAEFEITRDVFNTVVEPKYKETEEFIRSLLLENSMSFSDISRIILVGGTTYIPYIKDALKNISNTIIDDSVDPTTAVIVGAAYYAGSQPKPVSENPVVQNDQPKATIDIKLSYEAFTNDKEELIAFKTANPFTGYYRITRSDGGFDSGLRSFDQSASEFVTLIPKSKNTFRLGIFDIRQKEIYSNSAISISHGLYNVSGQLLPEDICIELDKNNGTTYLEPIFKRNNILPLNRTLYKVFSKSVIKNSDDKIIINVVEGKGGTMPGSNLSIGYIEISGKDISTDLIQGTDIELMLTMDESRGLNIEVYIPSSGQLIKHSFHISSRDVSVDKSLYDIAQAENILNREIRLSNDDEAYEVSALFQKIASDLNSLKGELHAIKNDNITAEKYRLDEKKRRLLGELDSLTRARDVHAALHKYREQKQLFIDRKGTATSQQLTAFENIVSREGEFLNSGDKHLIEKYQKELTELNWAIFLQSDENYVSLFYNIASRPPEHFKEPANLGFLIEEGIRHINEKNYQQLRQLVYVLSANVKNEFKKRENPDEQVGGGSTSNLGLR
ncbi:Hsp70 family protein [Mucilaginibacter sp. BJC16-A38]|uniref:Hsp70 family protein n=1 Tax=Mucilaginibacter phenanthrenivorans TaxID=1234842 RepID=UPI002157BCD0|nr:Hsp70 family protein [Mucilaginibacter phenanthrenivorans]MCR8559678.1 Hsp70 family protein [Mucilaginibacter phenanthrenivorans]